MTLSSVFKRFARWRDRSEDRSTTHSPHASGTAIDGEEGYLLIDQLAEEGWNKFVQWTITPRLHSLGNRGIPTPGRAISKRTVVLLPHPGDDSSWLGVGGQYFRYEPKHSTDDPIIVGDRATSAVIMRNYLFVL